MSFGHTASAGTFPIPGAETKEGNVRSASGASDRQASRGAGSSSPALNNLTVIPAMLATRGTDSDQAGRMLALR
jgi:hypothetical protein